MKFSGRIKDCPTSFALLENDMSEKDCEQYYNLWIKKYSSYVSQNGEAGKIILASRCNRARKEVWASARFWAEAETAKENGCTATFFFCCYYSLFHALLGVVYLNSDIDDKVVEITHRKLKNVFCDYYARKGSIFDESFPDFIDECRYFREYYSYTMPFNVKFAKAFDEEKLRKSIQRAYLLIDLHSYMLYDKRYGTRLNDDNAGIIIDKFRYYNFKRDLHGRYDTDEADDDALHEVLEYGVWCSPLEIEIGHDWDEMGYSSSIEPLFNEKEVSHIFWKAFLFICEVIKVL